MIKAVLDTNVIVSLTISIESNPTKILDFWREKKFELIITPAILEEIWQVLFRPVIKKYRKFSDEETGAFLFKLKNEATLITPTLELKIVDKDPADDEFIIAAIEGQANYIVSGDQHLLELKEYEGHKIVSPRDFVEILEANK